MLVGSSRSRRSGRQNKALEQKVKKIKLETTYTDQSQNTVMIQIPDQSGIQMIESCPIIEWLGIQMIVFQNGSVTRPLCLVESHTLDAAARRECSLFTSLIFCISCCENDLITKPVFRPWPTGH